MWRPKRQAPNKPTRKAIHAALQAQRPLDQDATVLVRKKAVKLNWNQDVSDIGDKNE